MTVSELSNHLEFISDSSEVQTIRESLALTAEEDFDSFFVHCENGEYVEVWGMSGIVPHNDKQVFSIDLSPTALMVSPAVQVLDAFTNHTKDSDCTVNEETGLCDVCGVGHSDECPDCGGRGFHKPVCPILLSNRTVPATLDSEDDSSESAETFRNAVQKFTDASFHLSEMWMGMDSKQQDAAAIQYPFSQSFDELCYRILDWNEAVKVNVKADAK